MHPLDRFDAFEMVSNDDLKAVYWDAVRNGNEDEDLPYIAREMVKRGLLGSC